VTADEILEQLDACAGEFSFPMLDNGYVYPVDQRLSVFRDAERWLIIIEVVGANSPRLGGYDAFVNCLHLFGNCLHRNPGTANEDFLALIGPCAEGSIFASQYEWFAKPDARCVMIRDRRVELDFSPEVLKAKGIELMEPPQIDPPALLRSLVPEHRESLLATAEELARRNPHNLPLWMRLEEWHHPDVAGDEKPSECETFVMLAKAIVSGDTMDYRPTLSANTHWRNWPNGGTL
jgi:hypothetical protein